MRIEVVIGSDEPKVFPLKPGKLSVGSSVNNDVIIKAEGISRKHLVLEFENDTCSVVDQGSTNGTFLNDERLVPGKKIPFTTFFPLKLGFNVFISLIADDVRDVEGETRTTVLPIDGVNKTKTGGSIQVDRMPSERKTERTNKELKKAATAITKPQTADDLMKKFGVPAIALTIFGAAFYVNVFLKEPEVVTESEPEVAPVSPSKKSSQTKNQTPVANAKAPLVTPPGLMPRSQMQPMLKDPKCANDLEALLCNVFPGSRDGNFGVVQKDNNFIMLVNGSRYIEEITAAIKAPEDKTPANLEKYEKLLLDASAFMYLTKLQGKVETIRFSPESKFYVALFRFEGGIFQVYRAIHISMDSINNRESFATDSNLDKIKTTGEEGLQVASGKYDLY